MIKNRIILNNFEIDKKKDYVCELYYLKSKNWSNSIYIAFLKQLENQILTEINYIKNYSLFSLILNYTIKQNKLLSNNSFISKTSKVNLTFIEIENLYLKEININKQKIKMIIYNIRHKFNHFNYDLKYLSKEQKFKYNQYHLKIRFLNNQLKNINKKFKN